MTDLNKWNAEDRRLVSSIKDVEAKLAEARVTREQRPHLAAACDEWIARYESQLAEMRAQLEQIKSLYA